MPEPYSKAPITEAVIDFRVADSDSVMLESLVSLKEALLADFPEQQDLFLGSGELRSEETPTSTISRIHIGFKLTSEDKRQVVQITTQGFTFSRLTPYERWETFRDEARGLWSSYKAACHISTVNRVGIRYINRLDFPASGKINAYLLLHPAIPQYRYREYAGLFMQLQIPQPDIDSLLIINQALVEPPDPESISLVLDLDLFCQATWKVQDDVNLWAFLETLRERKNEVFEASIIQKTREMIE